MHILTVHAYLSGSGVVAIIAVSAYMASVDIRTVLIPSEIKQT